MCWEGGGADTITSQAVGALWARLKEGFRRHSAAGHLRIFIKGSPAKRGCSSAGTREETSVKRRQWGWGGL